MAPRKSIQDKIIDSSLILAAEKSWHAITLREIADHTGCSLAELRSAFTSKTAILNGFIRRMDLAVLSKLEKDEGESPRDRLFEVLMHRFDALQDHRLAVVSIAKDLKKHPACGFLGVISLLKSMSWMLEAAGISASGFMGAVKARGLALLYGEAFQVWLNDESEDMAPTMVRLDRGLGRAERFMAYCCWPSSSRDENGAVAQNSVS